jgi:hypothetical protein
MGPFFLKLDSKSHTQEWVHVYMLYYLFIYLFIYFTGNRTSLAQNLESI